MHILLDADFTLLDSQYLDLSPFGISRETINPFFMEAFPPCATNNADLKEVLIPYLPQRGWTGTVDELLEYWFSSQTKIRDGMLDLVKDLQDAGNTVSLCTQQEKYRAAYMKNEMGFGTIFDTLYVSCELGYRKSDVRFYQAIVDVGSEDEKYLFVDDKQSNCDVATQAGIDSYHFDGDVHKLKTYLLDQGIIS